MGRRARNPLGADSLVPQCRGTAYRGAVATSPFAQPHGVPLLGHSSCDWVPVQDRDSTEERPTPAVAGVPVSHSLGIL